MSEFTPQYIEGFSPNRLAEGHHRYAPVLSVVLAKRGVEVLHRLGLGVAYETAISAL